MIMPKSYTCWFSILVLGGHRKGWEYKSSVLMHCALELSLGPSVRPWLSIEVLLLLWPLYQFTGAMLLAFCIAHRVHGAYIPGHSLV